MEPFETVSASQIPQTAAEETVQLTLPQFGACLRTLAKQAGTIADLAANLGVSPQFLGDVIAGRKRPGDKILSRFGARMVRVIEMPVLKDGASIDGSTHQDQ